MHKPSLLQPGLAIVVLILTAQSVADEQPQIGISASTPTVTLTPRAGGRFIDLPAMAFEFSLQPECPPDLQPASLTLSVADTRRSLRANDLLAESLASVTLEVPAGQLAPVATAGFCHADGTDETSSESLILTIRDTLSAQASLRCAGDGAEKIAYVSQALNVTIVCDTTATDNAGTAGDE